MRYFYKYILLVCSLAIADSFFSQSLVSLPCAPLGAGNEWTDGDCSAVSTAGFADNFDITSCGPGLTTTIDGWGWYAGTGTGDNTLTFTPGAGEDVIIQVFESAGDPCVDGFFNGECADASGAGGAESVTGGGVAGTNYIIIIENAAGAGAVTGTLCMTENPASCTDGLQNGTETCVDGGGSCPYGCPPTTTASTGSCSNTVNTTVDVITCDLIGTSGFTASSGLVSVSGGVKNGVSGAPAPSCGWPSGNINNLYSSWITYDPLTGVTDGSFYAEGITGTKDISYILYEGACGSLVENDCGTMATISGVNFSLDAVNFSGIDATQPYHLLLYSTAAFGMTSTMLQGFGSPAPNDICANATPATSQGCNAGASPDSFIPPGNYVACDGGGWTTNENTVYYTFVPDDANATLEIDNITCDDGSSNGAAQFGVWTSCAPINSPPSVNVLTGFLGCAVGTSPLILSGLTIGQTYLIGVDGTAGSICSWDFSGSGIVLPIKLLEFNAQMNNGKVDVDWVTESELNNDYFTIEKSLDGITYEVVGIVDGAGNSNVALNYNHKDEQPFVGVSYYRLKQTDYDGQYTYSQSIPVNNEVEFSDVKVNPNPVEDNATLSFTSKGDETINVQVINIAGKLVINKNVKTVKGLNNFNLDIDHINSGMYFVNISNSNSKKNFKFVKD